MSTIQSSTYTLESAANEYIARRDRRSNPPGTFDKQGRFYCDEKCDCCKGIRSPSVAYPYSEMLHARTLRHVAKVFKVSEKELRQFVKGVK